MQEILSRLAGNLIDFLVYLAIALVMVIGILKCILPVHKASRHLRKGAHMLESSSGAGRPVWQDTLFLGRDMQVAWRRFLVNAEQLDARGLNCNVEDYVNDDTVIYSVGHAQLAEVIPSLLTSLGILGTFIGLMRGLGGLDVSDAAKTMESIPQMIGGMTFAFMTSIAGISCSLIFNMLNRMAYGSATRAIDDFQDTFVNLVMQKPLEDSVQLICQQEDRSALLRHMGTELGSRVSEGILSAVERSLMPVAQSMNSFILGQTQAQIDGVANIANQFVQQMNLSLGGQLTQLAQNLSAVNQAQSISMESLERAMASADQVLSGMQQVQSVTEQVMRRFENYVRTMERAQQNEDEFISQSSRVLSGMASAFHDQTEILSGLQTAQQDLRAGMRDYTNWSDQVIQAVREQANGAAQVTMDMTDRLQDTNKRLSEASAAFSKSLSEGFSQSMGLFDRNMRQALSALTQKLEEIRALSADVPSQAEKYQAETENCVTAIRQLQQAVSALNAAVAGKPTEVA